MSIIWDKYNCFLEKVVFLLRFSKKHQEDYLKFDPDNMGSLLSKLYVDLNSFWKEMNATRFPKRFKEVFLVTAVIFSARQDYERVELFSVSLTGNLGPSKAREPNMVGFGYYWVDVKSIDNILKYVFWLHFKSIKLNWKLESI